MRTSLSQVENIRDLSKTPDEAKPPVRELPRRPQRVFNLNDAKALKVNSDVFAQRHVLSLIQ